MTPNSPSNPSASTGTEPTAGLAAVPIWLVVIFGGLFLWGQLYLDGHAGNFSETVFAPYHSPEEVADANPKSEGDDAIARGKIVFGMSCAACHQPNGMGKEGQWPPLAGSDWIQAEGPGRIGRIVLDGITGTVTVAGKEYNLNATMTPFRDTFTDQQLADALSFVRNSWGNKGSVIKVDEIKTIRKATADHHGPWTADDLNKIPVK